MAGAVCRPRGEQIGLSNPEKGTPLPPRSAKEPGVNALLERHCVQASGTGKVLQRPDFLAAYGPEDPCWQAVGRSLGQ